MSKTVSYLRVSTTMQDNEKNKAAILQFANNNRLGNVEWVEDKESGAISFKKRKLGNLLESLENGDVLIVSEMSRIGRTTLEVMEVLSIAMRQGITVYAIKGNWKLDPTMQSHLMAFAYSLGAQLERELNNARVIEGVENAKVNGTKTGRPFGRPKGGSLNGEAKSKLDQFRPEIEALLANGSTQKFIASRYGCTEANLSLWIKKKGVRKASG